MSTLTLHLGAVKRVKERFLCTRALKIVLLHLPLLKIRPGGVAIEFEYESRPVIKPVIFKQFTLALDVFQ